jgi:hypothetical protein
MPTSIPDPVCSTMQPRPPERKLLGRRLLLRRFRGRRSEANCSTDEPVFRPLQKKSWQRVWAPVGPTQASIRFSQIGGPRSI